MNSGESEPVEQPETTGSSIHRTIKAQLPVRQAIAAGALLTSPYLIMNALATIVASYGLLANSTAVVIGAMIIAMLLGPIMGLALAIVDGDGRLLRRALVAEVVGAAIVLALGFLIGRMHGALPITAEILSRTKPNLLDLAVALAGGAAGAYATVSPRVSVGLVGVAISTALVPPLAACGICLSKGLMDLAAGAFILFATNLVAIQCASSIVLFAFGFHKVTHRHDDDKAYLGRLVVDAVLFLGLAVFLTFQLGSTVRQQQFEELIKSRLQKGLLAIPGTYLAETRFVAENDLDIIVAVIRVPNSITPEQTAKLQQLLPPRDSRRLELHVRSLLTKETTSQGYLHEITPLAPPADAVPVPQPVEEDPIVLPPIPGVPDGTSPEPDVNPQTRPGSHKDEGGG